MDATPLTIAPGEALAPAQVAAKTEATGVAKAAMPVAQTFVLAIAAGAFISLGAIFSTTVLAGSADLPYGVARLLAGVSFSLGLILVVLAGAELFTGNVLIVVAALERRVVVRRMLANWGLVWVGNLVGALATVALMVAARGWEAGGGAVGETALSIGAAKTDHGFVQAVALGVLCNGLVCLAVWLAYGARSTTDKILAVVFPVSAFVAAGFEHSIANMYFLPFALAVKHQDAFVAATPGLPDLSTLTLPHVVLGNLLPVTIGNAIGGAVLVGWLYWVAYLRRARV